MELETTSFIFLRLEESAKFQVLFNLYKKIPTIDQNAEYVDYMYMGQDYADVEADLQTLSSIWGFPLSFRVNDIVMKATPHGGVVRENIAPSYDKPHIS